MIAATSFFLRPRTTEQEALFLRLAVREQHPPALIFHSSRSCVTTTLPGNVVHCKTRRSLFAAIRQASRQNSFCVTNSVFLLVLLRCLMSPKKLAFWLTDAQTLHKVGARFLVRLLLPQIFLTSDRRIALQLGYIDNEFALLGFSAQPLEADTISEQLPSLTDIALRAQKLTQFTDQQQASLRVAGRRYEL